MASEQAMAADATTQLANTNSTTQLTPFKYSNRVLLKTILDCSDGGLELVGQRVVIGGWVKSSKEVRKELPPPPVGDHGPSDQTETRTDVSCVEILQSRIPFLRSIVKVLGGSSFQPLREKSEGEGVHRPPTPSTAFLKVSDGSCAASLPVVVESSIAPPRQVLHIGTCIVVEGVLHQTLIQRKRVIEVRVEKVHHIGTVDYSKYPLSKKRVVLDKLRDFSHIRARTTTVASIMRIRSALTFGAHTFLQNHGFLDVQVPIMTTTDCKGFSEKFQVTSPFGKAGEMEEPKAIAEIEGVSLEVIKAAVKEKSNIVDELKRTDSNKEALAAAVQDLKKTNELASQLEEREKSKSKTSQKVVNVNKPCEGFFSSPTYLTVSGRLHLESYACSLGNVYSFGPRFQPDKGQSTKHVAEMWMFEVEMAFSLLEDAINCADDFFKFLCKWVLENCPEDMKFVAERIDKTRIDHLQSMISTSFERLSYTEAFDALNKVTEKKVETKSGWGAALTDEDLSYLSDEIFKKPVIIYNYPKEAKPFYVRLNDDGKTVAAFDIFVPKVGKLISGSQNEERINMLSARIRELGLAREQYEWYLDLRRHGTVKHSGFNLEFDLMVLFATGLTDVRDAIPFPRSYGKANN